MTKIIITKKKSELIMWESKKPVNLWAVMHFARNKENIPMKDFSENLGDFKP